uniref:Uncharacterized protein n=1 Tax=Oryza sativa subsp. japonica TaxID=39947 RepID=Q6K434_ORYSJ|nr:hypothetical protein [Oryza sativa Japonica Group]
MVDLDHCFKSIAYNSLKYKLPSERIVTALVSMLSMTNIGILYIVVKEKKVVELSRRHSLKAVETTPFKGLNVNILLRNLQ